MSAVKSALRTLQILEVFDARRRPLTLAELARALGSPKSSTLALIDTLGDRGYLYRAARGEGYYPTRRWLQHAQGIAGSDPIAARVHQALTRLRDATGETAIHAVLAEGRTIYLDVVESTELIRYSARAGEEKSLPTSASGRALLAALPAGDCRRLIDRIPETQMQGPMAGARDALEARIGAERQRGWSSNRGEFRPDVSSLAAGLLINDAAHALVIAAPYQRLEGRFDEIGRVLHREAQGLARLFGGSHD